MVHTAFAKPANLPVVHRHGDAVSHGVHAAMYRHEVPAVDTTHTLCWSWCNMWLNIWQQHMVAKSHPTVCMLGLLVCEVHHYSNELPHMQVIIDGCLYCIQ